MAEDGVGITSSASGSAADPPMPEYLPFGPRDRQGALHFMALTLTSLQAAFPDAVTRLVGMCKRGIDVFTYYSGLGMPEHVFSCCDVNS